MCVCVAGKIGNEGLQLAEGKIYLIVISPQQAFVLLFVLSALYVIWWNYRCKCVFVRYGWKIWLFFVDHTLTVIIRIWVKASARVCVTVWFVRLSAWLQSHHQSCLWARRVSPHTHTHTLKSSRVTCWVAECVRMSVTYVTPDLSTSCDSHINTQDILNLKSPSPLSLSFWGSDSAVLLSGLECVLQCDWQWVI